MKWICIYFYTSPKMKCDNSSPISRKNNVKQTGGKTDQTIFSIRTIATFVTAVMTVSEQRLPSTVALSGKISSLGFFIPPPASLAVNSYLSWDLSAVGDINNDGFPDFAVAANDATVNSFTHAGEVFVVFGSQSIFTK